MRQTNLTYERIREVLAEHDALCGRLMGGDYTVDFTAIHEARLTLLTMDNIETLVRRIDKLEAQLGNDKTS